MTTYAEIYQGCTNKRGRVWSFDDKGKKICSQENAPFDPDKHLNGGPTQGLSPVKIETVNGIRKGSCRWIGNDIDEEIETKKFCQSIWKLGTQYFPFKSIGGRWHMHELLNNWLEVDEANKRSKANEKKLIKLNYKVDTGKTVPQSYTLHEDKPGAWLFMPYSGEYKHTQCYSPKGNPLSLKQFEFRVKWRKHLLIASAVGMKADDGRRKALFSCALYLKHNPLKLTLEEINEHFTDKATQKDIDHARNSVNKDEYDLEYLRNGTQKWLKENTGVYIEVDQEEIEEKIEELTTNLIDQYVYVRDRTDFFEKKTFKFVGKEGLNDWHLHITQGKKITSKLLMDPNMIKVHSYLTHAGLKPGVVKIKERQIPGVEPGVYLNNYQGCDVVAKKGDVSAIINYYKWLFGPEYWKIIEQIIAYYLLCPGVKILWVPVIVSPQEGAGKLLFARILASLLGTKNVRINVSFEDLTTGHSTILEGKQLIVLNEIVLSGRKDDTKELSNKLKSYFTDPTLIVNPKNKPQIEIPNFCNFFIFSNKRDCLHLDTKSRRYFVAIIEKTEEEILEKLEKQGAKKHILRAIEDPSALKYYFENDVKIPDKDIFYSSAPKTESREEIIDLSKSDFQKIMDTAYEEGSFPFANKVYSNGGHSAYSGLVIRDEFIIRLQRDPLFKSPFYNLNILEQWLKEKCIRWPNGATTKQIIFRDKSSFNLETGYGQIRRRAYLIHNKTTEDGRELKALTEGELGQYHLTHGYQQLSHQEIRDSYEKFERGETRCWSCKKAIDPESDTKCSKCNYGIPCSNPQCKKCLCDNPKSKMYKKDVRNIHQKEMKYNDPPGMSEGDPITGQ